MTYYDVLFIYLEVSSVEFTFSMVAYKTPKDSDRRMKRRTTIYIEDELLKRLSLIERNISAAISELVREALAARSDPWARLMEISQEKARIEALYLQQLELCKGAEEGQEFFKQLAERFALRAKTRGMTPQAQLNWAASWLSEAQGFDPTIKNVGDLINRLQFLTKNQSSPKQTPKSDETPGGTALKQAPGINYRSITGIDPGVNRKANSVPSTEPRTDQLPLGSECSTQNRPFEEVTDSQLVSLFGPEPWTPEKRSPGPKRPEGQ